MGEMRDSDWSRENLLRSDWLRLIGATITTQVLEKGSSPESEGNFVVIIIANLIDFQNFAFRVTYIVVFIETKIFLITVSYC